jgi:hypothetical protein
LVRNGLLQLMVLSVAQLRLLWWHCCTSLCTELLLQLLVWCVAH